MPKIEKNKGEIDRILCLPYDPRSPEDEESVQDLIEEYTQKLKTPNGSWSLKAAQALTLAKLAEEKGCIASIAVGGGKSLISALAPRVLDLGPYETVLLTRARLKEPWWREFNKYKAQFQVDPHIRIVSYAELSHPDQGPILLDNFKPKLIIADEAHNLSGEDSSRRNRFEWFFERHPDTMLLAMSGTITKRTLKDYEHLAKIALGEDRTPLPTSYKLMEAFCAVLDPEREDRWPQHWQWDLVSPLNEVFGDGRKLSSITSQTERREVARAAFYARVKSTPGMIYTERGSVGSSLTIDAIMDLRLPTEVHNAIRAVEREYLLPNGDELESPLDKARAIQQIAQGCYYYWDWPGEPDLDWLEKRRSKSRHIRRAIKEGPREIDSPTLVKRAIRDDTVFDTDYELLRAWQEWQPHRHKDPPPTKPHWMSEYLIDDVMKRAKQHGARKPAIIWYQHRYVAEKLAEKGLRWYDPQDGDNPELADPKDGPIVLSVDSHVEGLNMQYNWSRNIILCPMADAGAWEQLIGRTHRSGQPEDTVSVEVYAHVPAYRDTIRRALKNARFAKQTMGQDQKILIADWLKTV